MFLQALMILISYFSGNLSIFICSNLEKLVRYSLNIWDVGGQKTIRSYWRNYFEQTDGLVWVVDSSDVRRLDDCRMELENLLKEEVSDPITLLRIKFHYSSYNFHRQLRFVMLWIDPLISCCCCSAFILGGEPSCSELNHADQHSFSITSKIEP